MWFGKLTVFTSFKVSVSVFRSLEMVSNINTFVFFDIETSGLDRVRVEAVFISGLNIIMLIIQVRDRITEVSLQAVLVKDFLKTAEEALGPVSVDQPAAIETNNRGKKLPRILFKTRFCVNPTKFIRHEASLVSGEKLRHLDR